MDHASGMFVRMHIEWLTDERTPFRSWRAVPVQSGISFGELRPIGDVGKQTRGPARETLSQQPMGEELAIRANPSKSLRQINPLRSNRSQNQNAPTAGLRKQQRGDGQTSRELL
jgi:hypothetical protein